MMSIRKPAVADQFHFGCPEGLSASVVMLPGGVNESRRSEQ
jgi:hypothetical protein